MYGAAVFDACEQIMARMEPIASQQNFNSFVEVFLYFQFLPLSLYEVIHSE
jgi:xanthine dehydrogenase/oxidase